MSSYTNNKNLNSLSDVAPVTGEESFEMGRLSTAESR